MAKQPSKKASTGRNPERRNGKAWKKDKDKPAKVRTPERQAKNIEIGLARLARKEANFEARLRVKEAEARKAALLEEERQVRLEEQLREIEDAEKIRGIFENNMFGLLVD